MDAEGFGSLGRPQLLKIRRHVASVHRSRARRGRSPTRKLSVGTPLDSRHRGVVLHIRRPCSRQRPLPLVAVGRLIDRDASVVFEQEGVVRAAQALQLFNRGEVRAQIAGHRWQRPVRGVLVLHNGPLTDLQRAWCALLSCPERSALAGLTALTIEGFTGFDPRTSKQQVVLPEGALRPSNRFVQPHWSTKLDPVDVHPTKQPRRTRPQRSLIDEASWSRESRRARALVLAGIQQGLARPSDLHDALGRRGPCRHRALIRESIFDAAGGVHSLPERDFESIRRRAGLPQPSRQRPVRREDGCYFLDVGWDEFDAGVEIHGIPHLDILQWDRDLFRANEIAVIGPRLLIFSSYAVRHEPGTVAKQVRGLLRRGGWTG